MQTFKVTINGQEVEARADQTILDVVRNHRLDEIPTLCHDPKLPPYGSCYLCVVEIQGVSKLVPSCASPVAPGMVITTHNDRIQKARKTALELLLSNHYADCLGPCKLTCPAGVDVQGYIALMSLGKHREAVRLIKETNPLPLVCGRVCVRECEIACRRNRVDDQVGIDYLKRYATDIDIEDPWMPAVPPANGKKVAVVGGGPAGLTCAYYLILKGYAVTLYEKAPHLGGMLRYGIPEYRLPKELLDREIGLIIGLGVEVHLNTSVGKEITLEELRKKFDAVFLSFGAQAAKVMRIPDEDKIEGVLPGIDFLCRVQDEEKPKVHGKVVVVGGGNTAIDAARTARRLGADQVTLLYRRTRKEMPAHDMEIEAALHEEVELVELAAPTSLISENGRLKALECIRMELGEPDASGRRSPVPKAGSEYTLPCDFVISAIGQDVDLCGLDKREELKATRWSTPVFDEATLTTSIPGVFAGGDMATGPSVAIAAIAHGKIAANSIDHFVRTGSAAPSPKPFVSRRDDFGDIPDVEFSQFSKIDKEKMPELAPGKRVGDFREVETGFTPDQMQRETERCLECGCSAFFTCELRRYAEQFSVDISRFIGEVNKYKVDKHHPFITLDPNKCIACGRCVRTCSEVLKVSALGFVYRGFRAVVKPSMEKHLLQTDCVSCGNCIAACPTGAISERPPFRKPGPWRFTDRETTCHFCSVGCRMKYQVYDRDIYMAGNVDGDSHNRGYLCGKGRFGYRYMQDPERLIKPLVRKNGRLEEVDWAEAIDYTASRLAPLLSEGDGNRIAVTASPRLKNEELYLLQRWARAGLHTNQVGSFTRLLNPSDSDRLHDMIGVAASTITFDELAVADVIITLNTDLVEENLVAEIKIKHAQSKGTRLAVFQSYESALAKLADLWVDGKRGTQGYLLASLANALVEQKRTDQPFIDKRTAGFDDFVRSIQAASLEKALETCGISKEKWSQLFDWFADPEKKIVIIHNIDSTWERSPRDLLAAVDLLLLTGRLGKPGNGLIMLSNYANTQGALDMGIDSQWLPGQVDFGETGAIERLASAWKAPLGKIFQPVSLIESLRQGKTRALLAFGEDPLNLSENRKLIDSLQFLVVVDFFRTATAEEADVVFPLATPLETDGSYTSVDRRWQSAPAIFAPATGLENWHLIVLLAEKLGAPLPFASFADIARSMQQDNRLYRDISPDGGVWDPTSRLTGLKMRFAPLGTDVTPSSRPTPVFLASEEYYLQKIKNRLMI